MHSPIPESWLAPSGPPEAPGFQQDLAQRCLHAAQAAAEGAIAAKALQGHVAAGRDPREWPVTGAAQPAGLVWLQEPSTHSAAGPHLMPPASGSEGGKAALFPPATIQQ